MSEKKNTNYNSFTVYGNLTADLDINESHPNIATIHLATNDQPDWTSYLDIAFNGEARIAELKAQLTKGTFVKVEGAMHQDRWEKDGQKRSKLVLSAIKVEFPKASAE